MSKQKVKGGEVIHIDIGRHCTSKSEKRDVIFECHLHRAIWHQRWRMAFSLMFGWPIHLVMTGVDLRVRDRRVSEIEL